MTSGVNHILKAFNAPGNLDLEKVGIRIAERAVSRLNFGAAKEVPIIGQVAAGQPIAFLPVKSYRQISPIPGNTRTDKFVVMQVCGESMGGAGILNGDFVIACIIRTSREDDIVIAHTPFGCVLKFLHRQGDRVLLRSANEEFNDLAWEAQDLQVQGIINSVERDL